MAQEDKIQIFEYEGKPITFDFKDGQKMVNATEMRKAFPSKKVNDFLRLKQTKAFIKVLESRYGNSRNGNKYKALRVVQGGVPELQGTWMDERLALKFASWLNAHFELWVYDRIHELLLRGTQIQMSPNQINNLKALEWVFQKIKDNAMEIHHLSDVLDDLKDEEIE